MVHRCLAEWVYLTVMTGYSPYRLGVDLNAEVTDRLAETARVAARGGLIDYIGNLSVNVYGCSTCPLCEPEVRLALLASDTCRTRRMAAAIGHCTWNPAACRLPRHPFFVFVAANPKIYLVPRYLLTMAWCASIIVGWWLGVLWKGGRRGLALFCFFLAAAAGLAALSVENTNPRFVERQLLSWVASNPSRVVYTDPETASRAHYYFRFAGRSMETVKTERPPSGSTVFHSADRVRQCEALPKCAGRARDFKPGESWSAVSVIEAPPKPIGALLRAAGLEDRVPPDLARRLISPGGRVTVQRREDLKTAPIRAGKMCAGWQAVVLT